MGNRMKAGDLARALKSINKERTLRNFKRSAMEFATQVNT